MAIRILAIADAPAVQAIAQQAYGSAIDPALLFAVPPLPARAIVVGDPAVPALVRLTHYQMSEQQIALMPNGLRQLLAASQGWSTQVSDFYPLSASSPAVTAQLLPFLATVLRAVIAKAPANMRATLAARPVWAGFDGNVTAAEGAQLVAQFKVAFPAAGSAGRYIWYSRLDAARDAVASSAVDV